MQVRIRPVFLYSLFLMGAALSLVQAEESRGATAMRSIREFQVLPENSAEVNRVNLQAAIDWASPRGAVLFIEPSDEPYPIAGGLVLRRNVSLIGVHGPVARGTRHPKKEQPVGSVFRIEDEKKVFLTVESATQVRGIQFWYPRQSRTDPEKVIAYPPTIQVSQTSSALGITLSYLTFFGEYATMDFAARPGLSCELILIEHCYGYPLSGQFIRIDRCYDIPRILHCHVNPAIQRLLYGDYPKAIIDSVVAQKTFAYVIEHTDNAQLIDIFAFGVYGGISLGSESYGQLTNFNLDCVVVGIHKTGSSSFNRNWQIAQGSIIANAGVVVQDIHPIIIEGQGHVSLSNVESFSGDNSVLSNAARSQDFLLIRGDQKITVSLFGCRMRNYAADEPITNLNPRAAFQAVACVDKDERFFNRIVQP